MRRVATIALVAVAPFAVAFQTPASPAINFVDISNFPMIRVVFTPPDDLRDVALDRADVTVSQDGEDVEFLLRDLGSEPIEVVLLLDTSGSMAGGPIEAARAAASDFVGQLPPTSDIAVVTFGTDVEIIADFGTEPEQLQAAIRTVTATGETSVYDAVIEAARLVDAAPLGRQFIILLSDGGDTESTASLGDATRALTGIDVGFFAIALPGSEFDPVALQALAVASRGQLVEVANAAGLSDVYNRIAAEVASQYAAVFEPLHGGASTFSVAIEGAGGRSEVTFAIELPRYVRPGSAPSPTATTTPANQLTPAPASVRSVTPPSVRRVPAPGFLQGGAALAIGLGALFVVLSVAFSLALWPQDQYERRRGLGESRSAIGPRVPRTGPIDVVRERAKELAEALLGTSQRGALSAALESAGVALRPGEWILLGLGASLGGGILGLLMGSLLLSLLLAAGGLAGSRIVLLRKASKRRAAFADQLAGTLQLLAGSLRAGYGVDQAINTVANEAEDPTAAEFARVVGETRLGRDLTGSLSALAVRMDSQDFRWVTDAIEIQRTVGGDLAEVLETVASTIRERNQIRRQVTALSAEGRMSAVVLVALPFVLGGFLSVTNPDYLGELLESPAGRIAIGIGVVLMAVGIVWIRKIVKIIF